MTIQFDILIIVFMRRLKKVLLLLVPLIAMASLDANAFPVFCSDIASAPDRVLTGCQFNAAPSTPQDASSNKIAVVGGVSDSIDDMVSMTPKNRQLFHVGRDALSDDLDQQKKGGSSPGATEKQTASAAVVDTNPSDAASEFLRRDEDWYYMNIDQDGTYLFFGDMLEEDESTTGMDEDEFLPDGIGIGKRWRF